MTISLWLMYNCSFFITNWAFLLEELQTIVYLEISSAYLLLNVFFFLSLGLIESLPLIMISFRFKLTMQMLLAISEFQGKNGMSSTFMAMCSSYNVHVSMLTFTCVLLQRLWSVRSVNNSDKLLQHQVDILLHFRS